MAEQELQLKPRKTKQFRQRRNSSDDELNDSDKTGDVS